MQEKITFFRDKKINCPACTKKVKIEILRQGGGRLNSVALRKDLRRIYAPSNKYGAVKPYLYSLYVCEHCWFASLREDFRSNAFDFSKINEFSEQRKLRSQILVKNHTLDFSQYRNLYTGLASYYLAIHCYNFYTNIKSIEFYKGFLSLRASWCAQDLSWEEEDEDFMVTSLYFRYLAALNYENFVSYTEKNTINEDIAFLGPDTDHDFGFKGAIYLSAFLGDEFAELVIDKNDRFTFYSKLLNRLSRSFGVGKKNKNSPSPFLDKIYDLYNIIKIKSVKLKDQLDASGSA